MRVEISQLILINIGASVSRENQYLTEGYKKALLQSNFKLKTKEIIKDQGNSDVMSFLQQTLEGRKQKMDKKSETQQHEQIPEAKNINEIKMKKEEKREKEEKE